MKVEMRCKVCGGEKLTKDAWLIWDFKNQEWIIQGILDDIFCEDCEEFFKECDEVEEDMSNVIVVEADDSR